MYKIAEKKKYKLRACEWCRWRKGSKCDDSVEHICMATPMSQQKTY